MVIKSGASITGEIILKLTEGEARALEAICGYGPDLFVKWFYKNCGTHYLKPHERDMRSLFEVVRNEIPKHLSQFDKARDVFRNEKVAISKESYHKHFKPNPETLK